MKRKKIIKLAVIFIVTGIAIGGGIGFYMFNMPHRDVQLAKVDFSVTSAQIVNEYLVDKEAANYKYLSDDGNSKILEIYGVVSKISEDYNGQKVILLKSDEDKAGVSATLTAEASINIANLSVGEKVKVKGVIRSGASYDEDLELYEHVVLDKSDIVK